MSKHIDWEMIPQGIACRDERGVWVGLICQDVAGECWTAKPEWELWGLDREKDQVLADRGFADFEAAVYYMLVHAYELDMLGCSDPDKYPPL